MTNKSENEKIDRIVNVFKEVFNDMQSKEMNEEQIDDYYENEITICCKDDNKYSFSRTKNLIKLYETKVKREHLEEKKHAVRVIQSCNKEDYQKENLKKYSS